MENLNCPFCGSPTAHNIKMLCLSSTDLYSSNDFTGGGYYGGGSGGAFGMSSSFESESSSALVKSLTPSSKPSVFNGLTAFLIFVMFLDCLSVSEEIQKDGPNMLGVAFGIAVFAMCLFLIFLMHVSAKSRMPDWLQDCKVYNHGWVCLRCGKKWIPKD